MGIQEHLSCYETGQSILETFNINSKNIHDTPEIEVSVNSNLSFTIQVFV